MELARKETVVEGINNQLSGSGNEDGPMLLSPSTLNTQVTSKQPNMHSVWASLSNLLPFRVIYGTIPVKTSKRPSNLIRGTFMWVQVSVGTEYQVILCINRGGSGRLVRVSFEWGEISNKGISAEQLMKD